MFSPMALLRAASTASSASSATVVPALGSLFVASRTRRFSSSGSSSSSKPSGPSSPSGRSANGPSSSSSSSSSSSNKLRLNSSPVMDAPTPDQSQVDKTAGAAVASVSKPPPKQKWGSIPFVPDTGHLHPADVATSTFFALHRPLSVSAPIPYTTPGQGSLFATTPPSAQSQRTTPSSGGGKSFLITPGSNMTNNLSPIANRDQGWWEYGLPFVPPPPPTKTAGLAYDDGPTSGVSIGDGDVVRGDEMFVISVKRQRKLKMKKHKYKKLMKKTRNQRRRIERQKN